MNNCHDIFGELYHMTFLHQLGLENFYNIFKNIFK